MRNKAKTIGSSRPEVFLGKGVLKICSKFTGEQQCRSVIHTSVWLFSCKFAAYFQNTFFIEHLWVAASELSGIIAISDKKGGLCLQGYYAPHLSLMFKLNSFFNIFSWNPQRKRNIF